MYESGFDNRMYPTSQGQYLNQPKPRKVTKKSLVEYLTMCFNASEVVQVDDFESLRQRHICGGSRQIILLDKTTQQIDTPEGVVYAEVFFCPNCRKLIINKSSIDVC